ncbi:MAG: carboxypeptidase-like regulatory domain-containing protein [Spirochaetes bacterium]|nr:carboxypeptidase-like regulatory domain-containing protein [Spirochaetota bacterium]
MIPLLFSSCPDPGSDAPESFTIGGQVRDGITGSGIPSAFVQIADRVTLTDADGDFRFTYADDATVTGKIFANKGLLYAFWGVQEVSLNPAANPRYNIYLDPQDFASNPAKTVTVVFQFVKGANPHLYGFCTNALEGRYMTEDLGAAASFQTYTYGSDCIVALKYSDDSHTTPIMQYYRLDLSSDINIDLADESDDTVTVNGLLDDLFSAELDLGPFHNIPDYASGGIASGTSVDIQVYNPDDHPIIWKNVVLAADSPVADFTSFMMHLGKSTAHGASVQLPAAPTTAPTETVDIDSDGWDQATGTISFNSPAGSTFCVLEFTDNDGRRGYVFSSLPQVDFSGNLWDYTLYPGEGWDVAYRPVYTTSSINSLIDMRIGGSGPCELEDTEISYVIGNDINDVSVDIIP